MYLPSDIIMKFAEYVAWILICKFGEKMCCNSRHRILHRGLLFWHTLYNYS